MAGVEKCTSCRVGKILCVPLGPPPHTARMWIEGGQQDKCNGCTRKGLDCGPSIFLSPKARAKRRLNTQPDNDKEELLQMLPDLDESLEAVTQLRRSVNSCVIIGLGILDFPDIDPEMIYANVFELVSMATKAASLLDRLLDIGDSETAEKGYVRLLEVYKAQFELGHKPWDKIRHVLSKLARIASEVGEVARADRLEWEALASHEDQEQARLEDYQKLKELALSSIQATACLELRLKRTPLGTIMRNLIHPFPLLQRMMLSDYAKNTSGSPFHRGPYLRADFISNEPIVGGFVSLLSLVGVVPVADLYMRDSRRRTPLHMAVSLQMEGFSWALIERIQGIPNSRIEQVVNSKDLNEQSLLATAIASNCSVELIKHLVDLGADVNPDLSLSFNTPLQEAASQGSVEIVALLLQSNAQ